MLMILSLNARSPAPRPYSDICVVQDVEDARGNVPQLGAHQLLEELV